MASQTSTIGSQTFPIVAGTADAQWDDPLAAAMGDYLAHWLNADLNTRLANLSGRTDEAVPDGNVYLYNPGRTMVRVPSLPALFVWRDSVQRREFTQTLDELWSVVRCYYVFSQLSKPEGLEAMNGLHQAVAGCLARATRIDHHSTWQYGAFATGASATRVFGVEGWAMRTQDVQFIEAMPEPGDRPITAARNTGGDGAQQHFYPVVSAAWDVREVIGPEQAEHYNAGITATRYHDDFLVEEREVPHPDPELIDHP